MINAATEIVELETKLPENIDKLGTRKSLELAASLDAEFFQLSLAFLADPPNLPDRQVPHEPGNFTRFHFKLAIGLVHFAGDLGNEFVRTNSCRGCQLRSPKDLLAYFVRQRSRRGRVRSDIEVSFVERQRFDC